MIDPSSLKREKLSYKDDDESAGRIAHRVLRNGINEPTRVLIESKEYPDGISEQCQAELVNRLSRITKLLREAGPAFRMLPCSGFYHDPSQDSCGLIYQQSLPLN